MDGESKPVVCEKEKACTPQRRAYFCTRIVFICTILNIGYELNIRRKINVIFIVCLQNKLLSLHSTDSLRNAINKH